MCKFLKFELNIQSELDTEEFEKEMDELEEKVHELLSANPDLRWEMTKFDFQKKL